MDPEKVATIASNGSVAVAVVVFLWRGLLPELRRQGAILRAIEKHLAAAGVRQVHVEGAIKHGFDALDDRLSNVQKDSSFLVSQAQQENGRTTRPTDAPRDPEDGGGL